MKTPFVENSSISQTPDTRASFLRFAVTGGVCFVVGLALLYLATSVCHIHYLLSSVGVSLLTTALSFSINRHLAFRGRAKHFWRELGRYYTVNFGSMALSTLLMGVLVSGLHIPYLAASILLSLIFCVGNFFFHQLWSFGAS